MSKISIKFLYLFLFLSLLVLVIAPTCFGDANPVTQCNGIYGTCLALDTCVCTTPLAFTGSECTIPVCFGLLDPGACNGGFGNCVAPDTCTCTNPAVFTGASCSTPVCFGSTDPSACNGAEGTCVAPDSCSCTTPANWGGTDCTTPVCFGLQADDPSVCNSVGSCVSPQNCLCSIGYGGSECELFFCGGSLSNETGIVCGGFGTCTSPNVCSCFAGYSGLLCQTFNCFGIANTDPTVCSGVGSCTSLDGCTCPAGYSGSQCEVYDCFSINSLDPTVCTNGNGVCTAPDTCVCSQGFEGADCSIVIPEPPAFCIVDNTIVTSNPDFEYIYWHNVSHAVQGCRAQPIQHIFVTSSQTIIDDAITFTRHNVNQTELLIEPLTPNAVKPVIVGKNHLLTNTYQKINITQMNWVSLNFPGGTVSSPGTNFPTIFGGTTQMLIMEKNMFQSLPNPTFVPSATNEPNINRLISVNVNGTSQFLDNQFLGSRIKALEVVDSLFGDATQGSTITIERNIGQHNWGSFLDLRGLHTLTIKDNMCNTLCGGIVLGLTQAVINVEFKTIGVPLPAQFYLDMTGNEALLSDIVTQSVNTGSVGLGLLTGIRVAELSSVSNDTIGISLFNFKNNIATGYPIGLRFEDVSNAILIQNYPIGHVSVLTDAREELRENSILNSNVNPTNGNFQGTVSDIVRGAQTTDSSRTSTNICNDFCFQQRPCCEVNIEFGPTTPGFGSFKFASVQDAIVHAPGGCNITTTRCVRLTRPQNDTILDPINTHYENICFDDLQDIILESQVNPGTGEAVILTGIHTLERNIQTKITIENVHFRANSSSHSTSSPIISPKPGILPVKYELDFTGFVADTAGGIDHNAEFILIPELDDAPITINSGTIKEGFNNVGGSIIRFNYATTNPTSCSNVKIENLQIDKVADNALWISNARQLTLTDNTINLCGSALPKPISFSCVYIKTCSVHFPSIPQLIQRNIMTGPTTPFYTTSNLADTYVTYTEKATPTPNLHYTHLWVDVPITQTTVNIFNPLPVQIRNISDNVIQNNVLVRTRINCWDKSGILTTTPLENQRIPLRTLNLQNKPQNFAFFVLFPSGGADFQDTICGTNDIGIASTPIPLQYTYCTQGCPPFSYNRPIFIFAIVLIAGLGFCCFFFVVLGGVRYFLGDEDEFYTGRLNVERNRYKKTLEFADENLNINIQSNIYTGLDQRKMKRMRIKK